MARGRGLAWVALGFAAAAALSAWNPLAAPFGLVVGLCAAGISARVLLGGGHRVPAAAALALALAAAAWSSAVLARTAGVGRELGEPVVSGPSGEDASRVLDEAAQRTRASRERARDELGKVQGEGGPPARDDGRPSR